MRTSRNLLLLLWVLAGLAGAVLLVWAWPRAFPFFPRPWEVNQEEAAAIAQERLRVLGEPVQDPFLVVFPASDPLLERRFDLAPALLRDARLRKSGIVWEVFVYPPGSLREDWTYRAKVALDGEVLSLRRRVEPQAKGGSIPPERARSAAEEFLSSQGVDLSQYGEPEVRSQQMAARTDMVVRFRHRLDPPGDGIQHGLEVSFAGDVLASFQPWLDDPGERALRNAFQSTSLAFLAGFLSIFAFIVVLAPLFLRRYHEGLIGVRRGTQIFLFVAACGAIYLFLTARAESQYQVGLGTRAQASWYYFLLFLLFQVLPAALLASLAWSVGESVARERWARKLASFDALFQRDWANATVARSSVAGCLAGVLLAGLVSTACLALRSVNAAPPATLWISAQSLMSRWPGLQLFTGLLCLSAPVVLALVLWLLTAAGQRLGRVAGVGLTVLVGGLALLAPLPPPGFGWGFLLSALYITVLVGLFFAADLLAALLAGLSSSVLVLGFPLLGAADGWLQLNGWMALALVALPLLVSLRSLGSDREFVYRYEDVPPHVRRIAERERQRVELETARSIQSSILPELPPSLNGVQIAHAYLPASEVGGDFYDVLALEDGRLAVAVGDVAGHGVSSGLVMSMAKSALAVQVTFDPDVSSVFRALNRTVFQTARKRLLATLCYAVLDPVRRELEYASAGHLFPYRITATGKVEALESVAYPLGVRGQLQVEPRTARLAPGDTLFLFSDGLVEARPEGSDQLYGFERLEQSLARHAHESVEKLRDAILADVESHAGHGLREDDQTVLVLRLP
jgi:hypothetical protein